ncbi:MAG: MarR family protein [Candidatus Bathyarchaeota archaeon BA1]|nr:MAG: MarR family protein [Candidatus Bathyarchaeota archaeon BA1]
MPGWYTVSDIVEVSLISLLLGFSLALTSRNILAGGTLQVLMLKEVESGGEPVHKLIRLRPDEAKLYTTVKEKREILQSDLIESMRFSKSKVTRILDKLESLGVLERRRHGMGNMVVLKMKLEAIEVERV